MKQFFFLILFCTTSAFCQITPPTTFALFQNDPDPFSHTTTIRFSLPQKTHVYLFITDSVGNNLLTLADEELQAGLWNFMFFADSSFAPGIYYCKIVADSFVDSIMMHYKIDITSVDYMAQLSKQRFVLKQNYPNPFNPTTHIDYKLPTRSFVSLKVYDLLGREIKTLINEQQSEGEHSVSFDAANLPSGVYFYCLQAGKYLEMKKLTVIK
ncbi:MAG TPA: T9SS type A sorting domain-containing protein [Bacteroidota bacterium]|jgi:hypothetical protein|nr:T9SS type A sorting domain-containing protein [Bacteroidota bacterium]